MSAIHGSAIRPWRGSPGAARRPGDTRTAPQLVVMVRWPAPLRCKRRLAAGVGAQRAAAIQARLTVHVLQEALAATAPIQDSCAPPEVGVQLVLAVSGLGPRASRRWARRLGGVRTVPQGSGGLGLRLQRQVRRARSEGAPSLVLIGSDLPELNAADLRQAFAALRQAPLVLGPARDGGYWLIGLRGDWPRLFSGHGAPIAWGSDQVLRQTLSAAAALGLQATLLPLRSDLDHPADLRRWR